MEADEETKNRVWGLIIKEYARHIIDPESRKGSWWVRMEAAGIKLLETQQPLPGHIVVGDGRLVFGKVIHIPVEVAEKILILGIVPK